MGGELRSLNNLLHDPLPGIRVNTNQAHIFVRVLTQALLQGFGSLLGIGTVNRRAAFPGVGLETSLVDMLQADPIALVDQGLKLFKGIWGVGQKAK